MYILLATWPATATSLLAAGLVDSTDVSVRAVHVTESIATVVSGGRGRCRRLAEVVVCCGSVCMRSTLLRRLRAQAAVDIVEETCARAEIQGNEQGNEHQLVREDANQIAKMRM